MAIVTIERGASNDRFCQNPLTPSRRTRGIAISLVVLFFSFFFSSAASADANTPLGAEAKRRYLRFYAPLILKEAQESGRNPGADLITNFDFDRNGIFKDNGKAWTANIGLYSARPDHADVVRWKIRPTLYSAAIEFKEGGSKSLILIYHVYHALEGGSLHDWERVEIRINDVTGTPGASPEKVRYVVYTEHTIHAVIADPKESAFTPKTATGKHILIWQARWINHNDKPDKNNLLAVTDSWTTLKSAVDCVSGVCPAVVGVSGGYGRQPVHYVFVPQDDPEQVDFWNATAITAGNATDSASGQTSAVNWPNVKRITYELQDLADIMATHADIPKCDSKLKPITENGWKPWDSHWKSSDNTAIMMDSAMKSEDGSLLLVPASADCTNDAAVIFHRYSKSDPDGAQGYPHKHWFWGSYKMNGEGSDMDEKAFNGGAMAGGNSATNPQSRLCKPGYKKYWCQHDYYAHTGNTSNTTHGKWLPVGWHTAAQGGSDGRWIQLFPDNP